MTPVRTQSRTASWLRVDLLRFDFRNSPVTGHCWLGRPFANGPIADSLRLNPPLPPLHVPGAGAAL